MLKTPDTVWYFPWPKKSKKEEYMIKNSKVRDIANITVMLMMFLFYSLTFMVPKFYGLTEDYVGVFIFVMLGLLTILNVNIFSEAKALKPDFLIIVALVIVTGVNLLIVKSGLGAFFVATDFALIWYLSEKIELKKWQFITIGASYLALILYWFFYTYNWMFADYRTYAMNTNTAATFTMFSLLCLFILLEHFYEKYPIVGLLMIIVLVKALQITLYHRGRGSFIMLIVFSLFRFIIPKKWWDKKGFYWTVVVFSTFGSLLFVAFYVFLGTTGVNFRLPFFYKNLFSGREAIWLEFWNLFKSKPLTGIGTNVTIESFFEFNVHNAMYNILVIHGVIVFALTIALMFIRLKKLRSSFRLSPVAFAALMSVFAVCIESFFDVDLIWCNYSFNLLFLLLAANIVPNVLKKKEDKSTDI